MESQGCALSLWLVVLVSFVMACDESASLLDIDALADYLNLTAEQTGTISGHVDEIAAIIENYIRTVRSLRGDAPSAGSAGDAPPAGEAALTVEQARRKAVARIEKIAEAIRGDLTPEQQTRFDRILLPDLRASPQELEFLISKTQRDVFTGLRIKPFSDIRITSLPDRADAAPSYDEIKEERTIVFGPGGFGSGLERFPVMVTAVLVDSVLAEAEFRAATPPDSLYGEAGAARRQAYYREHQVSDMLTIRLVLSTFLHEAYVDPDRWIVFLEDDKKTQYEPTEVIPDRGETPPQPSPLVPRGYKSEGMMDLARKARQYEIRFPYVDAFGYELLRPGVKRLRLVLFDRNDPSFRTFGEWSLK